MSAPGLNAHVKPDIHQREPAAQNETAEDGEAGNGDDAQQPEVGELPRRDRATYRGPVRVTAAPAPVTRHLAARIVRGLYEGWDVYTLGCFFVAAPVDGDPLTGTVINAGSVAELIQKMSETAEAAR